MEEKLNPDFAKVCSIIGTITVTWGWADLLLSFAIGIMFERLPPIKEHPEIPISMTKRLNYLKIALRLPAMDAAKDEGGLVAEKFARLKKARNDIVHSAAWQTQGPNFDTVRLDIKGRRQTAIYEAFDIDRATAFGMQVIGLVDDAHDFLAKVVSIFPKTVD